MLISLRVSTCSNNVNYTKNNLFTAKNTSKLNWFFVITGQFLPIKAFCTSNYIICNLFFALFRNHSLSFNHITHTTVTLKSSFQQLKNAANTFPSPWTAKEPTKQPNYLGYIKTLLDASSFKRWLHLQTTLKKNLKMHTRGHIILIKCVLRTSATKNKRNIRIWFNNYCDGVWKNLITV